MEKIAIDRPIPKVTVITTDPQIQSLSDCKGQNLVLYFYPKDSTPGCTLEGQDFKNNYKKFQRLNTQILGISRDSLQSHEKFMAKLELPFPSSVIYPMKSSVSYLTFWGKKIYTAKNPLGSSKYLSN